MSNKNFGQFNEAAVINNSDYFVGYTNTSPDGERRWSLENLMKRIHNVPYARLTEKSGVYSAVGNLKDITGVSGANFNPAQIILPEPPGTGAANAITMERVILLSEEYDTANLSVTSGNITFLVGGVYEFIFSSVTLISPYFGSEASIDFTLEKSNGVEVITGTAQVAKQLNASSLGNNASLAGRAPINAGDILRVKIRSNLGGGAKTPIVATFPKNPSTLFQLEVFKVG